MSGEAGEGASRAQRLTGQMIYALCALGALACLGWVAHLWLCPPGGMTTGAMVALTAAMIVGAHSLYATGWVVRWLIGGRKSSPLGYLRRG